MRTCRDKFKLNDIGLYRDDGLALFKRSSGPQAERKRKDVIKHIKNHGLGITIQSNLHIVNFLGVRCTTEPYRWIILPLQKAEQHHPVYRLQVKSPPSIFQHLPTAINMRISGISCNKKSVEKSKQHFEDTLKQSGHTTNFTYTTNRPSSHHRKYRQRKIIWFNTPYIRNVQTNVGKSFLGLITKDLPAGHKYHKIFNMDPKNTLRQSDHHITRMQLSGKNYLPLGKQLSYFVYNAKFTTTEDPTGKNCIGTTDGSFKQRYTQHALSFRNRHYANSTELSKFIWYLKDSNTDFEFKCSNLGPRRRLQQ